MKYQKYTWMQNFFLYPFYRQKGKRSASALKLNQESFEKDFDGINPEKNLLESNKPPFKAYG